VRGRPRDRLVALGVHEATVRSLIDQHNVARVVDADAVGALGEGSAARPGWAVPAIRQGWDLEELLAERHQAEARTLGGRPAVGA
jgi:hypothetical protein